MVLSSGEILTIGSGMQSHISGATPVKLAIKKQDDDKAVEIPKTHLKYHKIGKHDKYKITGIIPEYYISDKKVPKTDTEKLAQITSKYKLVTFKIPDETKDFYVKSCYQIDFISSPIRYKGEGTKAIKSLVEKSMTDKDTEGRIIVDVKITDGETSAAGFFYKIGFKFLDNNKNDMMQKWLKDEKSIISPKLTGVMYLPKESIQKLLVYKMLL